MSGLNHFDKAGYEAGNSRPIAVPGRDPLPPPLVVEKIALTMTPSRTFARLRRARRTACRERQSCLIFLGAIIDGPHWTSPRLDG
jgi:hypothetical protein